MYLTHSASSVAGKVVFSDRDKQERSEVVQKKNLFFAQKPNKKMNKHVNKVRKATCIADAITAGRQQNKQQYLIIQLMKTKESIKRPLLRIPTQ